jgi:serine-threonine kinase receptor-associated protein
MIRDGTTGDWIGTFSGHKGAVWSCQLDATGSLAATASGDFSVLVWDAITGERLREFAHKHIVKTCVFSPSSRLLATGGHEGLLRIFDLQNSAGTAVSEIAQNCGITKICWLEETSLLVGCADGKVRIWKLAGTAVPTAPLAVLTAVDGVEIRDMELQTIESGKRILTVASGDKVFFYDLATNKTMKEYKMPIHFRNEGGASLHPSGSKFIAGGSDLWVRVFDFESGKELECLKGHHGPIRCLRYAPDGAGFASGSEDGTIRLWKTDPTVEE